MDIKVHPLMNVTVVQVPKCGIRLQQISREFTVINEGIASWMEARHYILLNIAICTIKSCFLYNGYFKHNRKIPSNVSLKLFRNTMI